MRSLTASLTGFVCVVLAAVSSAQAQHHGHMGAATPMHYGGMNAAHMNMGSMHMSHMSQMDMVNNAPMGHSHMHSGFNGAGFNGSAAATPQATAPLIHNFTPVHSGHSGYGAMGGTGNSSAGSVVGHQHSSHANSNANASATTGTYASRHHNTTNTSASNTTTTQTGTATNLTGRNGTNVSSQSRHGANTATNGLGSQLPLANLATMSPFLNSNMSATGGTMQSASAMYASGIRNGSLLMPYGINGLGINGLGLNGLGVNGLGLNALGVNGLGLNRLGLNGLGGNALTMNALGLNALGFGSGLGLNNALLTQSVNPLLLAGNNRGVLTSQLNSRILLDRVAMQQDMMAGNTNQLQLDQARLINDLAMQQLLARNGGNLAGNGNRMGGNGRAR